MNYESANDRWASPLDAWKPTLVEVYRWATAPIRLTIRAIDRRRGTVPVAVLFYHRVDDRHPNAWTIGNAQFQRHLDWLCGRFDLVSLEEAQQRVSSGYNTRPTVSLTFDDGYADNCAVALPMLLSRGIPVTYFVSTCYVTTGQSFPHDVANGRPLAPNTIQSLRALAAAGVEIGAHTRTHVDLGTVTDPARLFDEVVTATKELESLIGRNIRYFAFPYGLPENLSAEAMNLARQHGIRGVCSAYGGLNEIGDDPFHIKRIHGDPALPLLKNWLTGDPRKRYWRLVDPHLQRGN